MTKKVLGSTRANALHQIDDFLSETGISARQLGLATVNCGKLVSKIRSGRPVTLGSIEVLESFIDAWRAECSRAAILGMALPDIRQRTAIAKAARIAEDARG